MSFDPCVLPAHRPSDETPRLGHPVLDRYLLFVAARCRRNTVLATVSDLRAFFAVVAKEPGEVVVADVLAFIHDQRQPSGDGRVVRIGQQANSCGNGAEARQVSADTWLCLRPADAD